MKKKSVVSLIILFLPLLAMLAVTGIAQNNPDQQQNSSKEMVEDAETALFAGGCFWCMEKPFEHLDGVISVISGYAGGTTEMPTYKNYAAGNHIEVVQIVFDPNKVSYGKLLDTFWRQIDPTDGGGQFVDRGHEYSSAIFYYDETQKEMAESSKRLLAESKIFNKKIVTPIVIAEKFWPAEEYHQDYYKKSPLRYGFYRKGSGRDSFLNKHWQGKDIKELAPAGEKKAMSTGGSKNSTDHLSPLQFKVTQQDDTEPPFNNEYWDNKRPGIYVDIVSGEPLFSSLDKFKSGTGWPSFSQPLVRENVIEHSDMTWLMVRTEVRSKNGDSHLGHVFEDGPEPSGLRYCINSASLRFIAVEDLVNKGYPEFIPLFK